MKVSERFHRHAAHSYCDRKLREGEDKARTEGRKKVEGGKRRKANRQEGGKRGEGEKRRLPQALGPGP